jgi:hypothetical protein
MLRISFIVTVIVCVFALTAPAADIDGKWAWTSTVKRQEQEITTTTTLDLKSEGNKLTGTLTATTPRGDRTNDIQDGMVEGNKFSFKTVQKGRQGEMTILWEGTVTGDEMRGEQKREGSDRGRPFTAKRQ